MWYTSNERCTLILDKLLYKLSSFYTYPNYQVSLSSTGCINQIKILLVQQSDVHYFNISW